MSAGCLTARAIAAAVRGGEMSAEEVVRSALAALDRGAGFNAVAHRCDEEALRRARAIDARRARGAALGPLAGVPAAVKDNICTRGIPTTCGSRILADHRPPYDATAVERLLAADAVVICKTNCDEFGMGSSTENSCYGPAHHPLDSARTPGGSSGGSAVVVADGQAPLALGSDTGGSVRQPAAFCGVVGLKPTYGRVSRWGLVAFGSSLDQIGPICRDVGDASLTLSVIAGPDDRDATCAAVEAPQPVEAPPGVAGLRIGLLADFVEAEGVDPAVRKAVGDAAAALVDAGASVVPVRVSLAKSSIPIYYLVATSEASSNLARYDGVRYGPRAGGPADLAALYERTRGAGFGAEVKRRIMLGTYALSAGYYEAYYGRAVRARAALRRELDEVFRQVDLLLLPTAPTPAFRLGEKIEDPLAMYLSDVFTVLANLGGHPAISAPAPRAAQELPVGVQLMAPHFAEARLFAGAFALEERGFRAW